jgi:hypothetical protein
MNESLPDDHAGRRGADRLAAGSIWPTFALMTAIWMVLALYTNERVLTPRVLANLATSGGGMAMPADRADDFQLIGRLAYALLPVFLLARVGVTALVLQLFTLLLSVEIAYRDLFQASLWGFGAVIYGMFIRTLRLELLGLDITVSDLGVVPDSLAALLMDPAPTVAVGYDALSFLSIHGVLWIGIVYAYLRFECGVTSRRALVVPLTGWTTISLAQLGLHAFTAQILG